MTSLVKTYWLAPNWDFPPGGVISLGSIITDPNKPQRILNRGAQTEVPQDKILHGVKRDWEIARSNLFETRIGVFATFLQIFGLEANGGYNHTRSSTEIYRCASLETDHFLADDDYIFKSLQHPDVEKHVRHTGYNKSVYMITGLRVARGFSVTKSHSGSHGGDGKIGADLTSVAAPFTFGPELKISRTQSENASFTGSSDCVFAYQLVKIRSRRNEKIMAKDYNKGALFNTDRHGDPKSSAADLRKDWDIEEMGGSPTESMSGSIKHAIDEVDNQDCLVMDGGD